MQLVLSDASDHEGIADEPIFSFLKSSILLHCFPIAKFFPSVQVFYGFFKFQLVSPHISCAQALVLQAESEI